MRSGVTMTRRQKALNTLMNLDFTLDERQGRALSREVTLSSFYFKTSLWQLCCK